MIARGEHTNHSHVVVGDATVTRNDKGEILVAVGEEGATLRHILESNFVETGEEVWTGEHKDIELQPNTEYNYVAQVEFDPFEKTIQRVRD